MGFDMRIARLSEDIRSSLKKIFRRPYRFKRDGGLGDVLLAMPMLRSLKAADPDRPIYFRTKYTELVRGLPFIDRVISSTESERWWRKHLVIGYERSIPPPEEHLAKVMGSGFGVDVQNVRPECVIDGALVARFRQSWGVALYPRVIVQRHASGWTPNKDWPEEYWDEFLGSLKGKATTIEIGDQPAREADKSLADIDLRGTLTVEELVAVIAAADMLVGPVSGPTHIAAAVRTPAVVIVGGYESPVNTSYEGNIMLSAQPSCSPCWLRTPCPKGLACLRAITPQAVESALWSLPRVRGASLDIA